MYLSFCRLTQVLPSCFTADQCYMLITREVSMQRRRGSTQLPAHIFKEVLVMSDFSSLPGDLGWAYVVYVVYVVHEGRGSSSSKQRGP
ncbi:unnamed protein product [Pleuronectes platessa]|uniref:Uncharacterized protein n=1 Tax=Pleuronectes platessa TaxID=8262 RepID=A0A9N7Z4C5_PLEPL|nr:unnamed protein product [Pleuronectes platessa]